MAMNELEANAYHWMVDMLESIEVGLVVLEGVLVVLEFVLVVLVEWVTRLFIE